MLGFLKFSFHLFQTVRVAQFEQFSRSYSIRASTVFINIFNWKIFVDALTFPIVLTS
jgi:hypothetical protein